MQGGNIMAKKEKKIFPIQKQICYHIRRIYVESLQTDICIKVGDVKYPTIELCNKHRTKYEEPLYQMHYEDQAIHIKVTPSLSKKIQFVMLLPNAIYDKLTVVTTTGNIRLGKGLRIHKVNLVTQSGTVHAKIFSKKFYCSTISGKQKIHLIGHADCRIKLHSLSGKIDLILTGFVKAKLSFDSNTGNLKNFFHSCPLGYHAHIKAYTLDANMSLRSQ